MEWLGKVWGPLGGAADKNSIVSISTNFKDMETIENALESWNNFLFDNKKIFLVFDPFL